MVNKHGKVIGLDVGDQRIGVAASDPTRLIASPLTIVERAKGEPVQAVLQSITESSSEIVVIGLPRNMDGTIGPQAKKTMAFGNQIKLQMPEISIVYWDERLSTMEARNILRSSGASRKRRQRPVDAVSAAVILQSYLDHLRSTPDAG